MSPAALMIAGVDGSRWLLLGVVGENTKNVRLVFEDGTSTLLTADSTGVIEWSGPSTPLPSKIESDGQSCSLSDNPPSLGNMSFPPISSTDGHTPTSDDIQKYLKQIESQSPSTDSFVVPCIGVDQINAAP